ncbi:MAG: sialidase family protein, partial [Candidatus Thorarchaeota archaeon]
MIPSLDLRYALILLLLVLGTPQSAAVEMSTQPVAGQNALSNGNEQTSTPEIQGFSQNILLSTDDTNYPHHVEVTMTISDNDTIFVGWKNAETHNGWGVRVSIVNSIDGGATWTEPFDMPFVSDGELGQSDPWLAWYNGCVYYAYLEYDVTVAKSCDYGATWTPIQATYADYIADKEIMAISSDGVVYVAYHDIDFFGNPEDVTRRLSRSIDGGNSYQEISVLGESGWNPYVTVNSSNHVYVVWVLYTETGGNLYLHRSSDQGATFGDSQVINDDGDFCDFTFTDDGNPAKGTIPLIKFDNTGRLYVLWIDKYDQDTDSYDVYLRYSDDFGETWSQRHQVNPTTPGDQWNPDMDIGPDGKLHIVYYDEQSGQYRPYYRTMEFTGEQRDTPILSEPIPIADTYTSSDFTRPGEYFGICLDSNGIPHI